MPYETLGTVSQLQLELPTPGSTDWSARYRANFAQKLVEHDHSQAGKGTQIPTAGIAADAITGAKIRLDNDEALRARNAGNTADINIVKINTSDKMELLTELGAALTIGNNIAVQHRNAADSAYIDTIKVNASDKVEIAEIGAALNITNNTAFQSRNAADSAYLELIKANASDKAVLGTEIGASVSLSNNIDLQARNAADSAYISLLKLNASDKAEIAAEIGAALKLSNNIALQSRNNADSAYLDLIKANASDRIELGQQVANLIMVNDTYVQARNNADSANLDVIKANTSDKLVFGTNIASANVEALNTSNIDSLDSAATLADNQAAATSAGVLTLSSGESATIHYQLIRNSVVQKGTLEYAFGDTTPTEEFSGTDVGITFSVNTGALEYTSTSTGFTTAMTYVIIKRG